MHLSDEDIEKFRAIYKGYFGKEISYEKALEDGYDLVRLMQLIYKPIRRIDYEKWQAEKRKNKLTQNPH